MSQLAKITTKTTNGATAFANQFIGADIEGSDELKSLVSIFSEIWSATGMAPQLLAQKMKECLILADGLEEQERYNFYALLMAYSLYSRDPRKGKGRRDESRATLFAICDKFSDNAEMCKTVISWYFKQGYWGDAKKIIELYTNPDKIKPVTDVFNSNPNLLEHITTITIDLVTEQLKKDLVLVKKIEELTIKTGTTPEELKALKEQLSSCAKWLPMPRSHAKKGLKKNGSKRECKNRVLMSLLIARKLFPNIQQNTTYYKQVNGQLDKTTAIPVTDATPVYLKWINLFTGYQKMMQHIRKHIPYVEKFTQLNKYHSVNPSMLTSKNKLGLHDALKNLPPRYIKTGTSSHIPAGKIKELKKRYTNTEKRFESNDRDSCAGKMKTYDEQVAEKLKEKQAKMAELMKKKQELIEAGKTDELDSLDTELADLAADKVTNFDAGTPIDVYKAYITSVTNTEIPTYENCINELALGKLADLVQIPTLCIADTSGSMYSNYYGGKEAITPIEMCIAMTAFFAKNAPVAWKHRFIQFSTNSYVTNLATELNKEDPSFFDYIRYMKSHQVNSGSTNFQSVVNQLRILFAKVDGQADPVLPKYLVWFSDMQFDMATQQYGVVNQANQVVELPAGQQLTKLFVEELGYAVDQVPTVVFWNVACSDNRPALAGENGVLMLSGPNPQLLIDIDATAASATPQTEYEACAEELRLAQKEEAAKKKRVDTFTSMINVLSTSEATVPFLEKLNEGLISHTLLDDGYEETTVII
jgi:hypothetical protein